MAVDAKHVFMAAIQFEVATPVMIEVPYFPVARVVALGTLSPKTELVYVFFLVARIALLLGVLVFRCFVALLAIGLEVFSQ